LEIMMKNLHVTITRLRGGSLYIRSPVPCICPRPKNLTAMLKFTALFALSLTAFGVAAAGKLDGCDSALIEHVRDPLERILDHLTPSERLLAEFDNETNVDPYAIVSNNPIQVNMMLMSESVVPSPPSPTMSSAMETATSGAQEEVLQGDAIIDKPGHDIETMTDGKCEPTGSSCDKQACIATRVWLCYLGTDNQCHWSQVDTSQTSYACANCYCTVKPPA